MTTHPIRRTLRQAMLALGLVAVGAAHAITGTWTGELADESGERSAVSYTFSPRGTLITSFQTRDGVKSIELQHVGQSAQWLAAGGGVAQGRVQALQVAADRFETQLSVVTDSQVAQGVLRQDETDMALVFQQAGGALHVVLQMQGQSTVTGFGPPRVDRWFSLHRGTLRRAD